MRRLVFAVGAALLANGASAATVTFSDARVLSDADISGVLSVPKFDAALGTLVGISWSITGAIVTTLGVTNDSGGAVAGSAFTEVDYDVTATELSLAASPDFSVIATTGNVGLGVGESVLFFSLAGSTTIIGAEAPGAHFVGPGAVELGYLTTVAFGAQGFGSDITLSQSTDAGIELVVTYDYVVPLPGALPLMLSALAGLGGLALRRRT